MKTKRLLYILIALVAICAIAIIGTAEETQVNVPTTCAACGGSPTWQPISALGDLKNLSALEAGHHHVYLDSVVNLTSSQQIQLGKDGTTGITVCLDLNGFGITSDGRASIIYQGNTLNIMDSSAEQTGYICGNRGSNNVQGGTISVQSGAELNLYSGTLRFQWNDTGARTLTSAGVVHVQAGSAMNMYGGKVEGPDLSQNSDFSHGGAILVSSTIVDDTVTAAAQLNVYGGEITSATLAEGGIAPCVYLARGTSMTLSGNAKVADIYTRPDSVSVSGEFSGEAYLTLVYTTIRDGLVVGSATDTPVITGKLFCSSGNGWNIRVSGEDLVLEAYTATEERDCPICEETVTWKVLTKDNYPRLKNLDGHQHYFLKEDYSSGQLAIDGAETLCLDLNGHAIKTDGRAIHISSGCTVNLMDNSVNQTGSVCGTSGSNNGAGGTVAVQSGATLNLYSGDLFFEWDDESGVALTSGGVVWVQGDGTMNMYGGVVEGADLMLNESFEYGAAIYVSHKEVTDENTQEVSYIPGNLNIYGGQITSGTLPETGKGDCVYLTQYAKMTLSGNPHVEEAVLSIGALTLSGTFTGEAWLDIRGTLAEGLVVGAATSTPVIDPNAELFCISPDGWHVLVNENDLILHAYSPYTEDRWCAHCNDTVTWKGITRSNYTQMKNPLADDQTHHFFLTEDFTTGQIILRNGSKACIDLNGKKINVLGRAFNVGENCTLNLMDIPDEKTGEVISTTGINNCGGGVVFMHTTSTFNLYSGTMSLNYAYVPTKGVGTGGIVYISGGATMNMYGGTINGAHLEKTEYTGIVLNGYGAAIYMGGKSTLNVSGGTIKSGTLGEGCTGKCVYVQSSNGRVALSGNAVVDEIYMSTEADQVTVRGNYTGSAHMVYPEGTKLTYKQRVGYAADSATLATAETLTCQEYFVVLVEGNYLVLDYNAAAAIVAPNGTIRDFADTLVEAVQKFTAADGYIMMLENVNENVDATGEDLYLDLNGCTVAGSITCNTLYGMDAYTNDYTVEDGKGYGKLSAAVTGDVKGLPEESTLSANLYLPIEEESIGTSFHAVNLNLSEMVLRSNCAGIFYKCPFAADEMVQPLVESYGVAMSLLVDPNEAELKKSEEDSKCEYSTFENFTSGGMDMDNTGTLLTGVMKTTNANTVNNRNAKAPVRGRAYIKTADGYIFGGVVKRTLRQQVEDADKMWDDLTDTQRTEFSDMFRTYNTVMRSWDVPNVAAAQKVDDSVLSILGIGNSYTMDSMWMLGQVYAAENPGKQIKLGIAYIGGCNLETHAANVHSGAAAYTYYELDSATGTWTKTESQTLKQIVSDADWDVVSLQQSSTLSDDAETYNGDIATIRQFVANTLCYTPDFVWNLTWAWPADPALKEDFTADQQTEMYNNILAAVQEKIVTDPAFKLIMPVGIAIQNANQTLADTDLYCDNTHLNAYGRIIAAYIWYCQLEDVEPSSLTALKVTITPAAFSRIHSAESEGEIVHSENLMHTALAAVRDALWFDLTPEETE